MPGGRSSTYTQEMSDKICDALSDGKSLRTVCAQEGFPERITVFKWLREREGFAAQYARAKQEAADALADDMTAIADDETLDPNSRRIRVDTRKWIASKLKPRVYGDKLDLGTGDSGPIVISWGKPAD